MPYSVGPLPATVRSLQNDCTDLISLQCYSMQRRDTTLSKIAVCPWQACGKMVPEQGSISSGHVMHKGTLLCICITAGMMCSQPSCRKAAEALCSSEFIAAMKIGQSANAVSWLHWAKQSRKDCVWKQAQYV